METSPDRMGRTGWRSGTDGDIAGPDGDIADRMATGPDGDHGAVAGVDRQARGALALSTIRLTVGQAIVRFMAAQYVERDGRQQRFIAGVWGIFGHGNVAGFGQALEELGDEYDMPYYRPQNEQAQVHAAAAFAKHNNRLRAFACTSSIGPGATNMITGAATATVNRLPVLLLPSDYFANRLVDPVLQQVEHPVEHDVSASDAFRPVSRYFDRISRPEQLISSLPEAFRVLTDPADTGAVTVSLPEDVQAEVYDWPARFFDKRVWRVRRPRPESEVTDEVVTLIRTAKRPLIVAGGGAIYSGAEAALDALATNYGIPVSESQAGKGVLPWNHPWNVGPIGSAGGLAANRLAREADLVIGVGTRMGDFVTASRTRLPGSGRHLRRDQRQCVRCRQDALRPGGCGRARRPRRHRRRAGSRCPPGDRAGLPGPGLLAQGRVGRAGHLPPHAHR